LIQSSNLQPVSVRFSINAEEAPINSGGQRSSEHKFIYGVAYDERRQRVLYSGLEGKISFFEALKNHAGTLLEVPGRAPLIQLALTPDRSALVATALQFFVKSKKQKPHCFQYWNYPALCKAAGLEY
jgi:hypothetical protein